MKKFIALIMMMFALTFVFSACNRSDDATTPEHTPEDAPEQTQEAELEYEPEPEPESEPEQPSIPQPKTTVYDLLTDPIIQNLAAGEVFEGRPGNTTIADSPYLAISTEWGGDVDLQIGIHENGSRYLHITNRTNMFIVRLNHSAINFQEGDVVTFSGRWSEPFFNLTDTWFSVIISAYGSQHEVVTMGQNYSSEMPEDGTFHIYGVITREMVEDNLNTGPPHSGVRLYIWTSGEEVGGYDLFLDSVTVTRGGE